MNFNIERHLRIAGSVTILVGLYFSNWIVMILGNFVIVVGYMMSVNKIERALERRDKNEL